MKVIGLTGNIGTGKTTVAEIFKNLGAKIIDADRMAREVVEPGQAALEELVSEFGSEILNRDGRLDRKHLSELVFNDAGKLEKLNNIIHPHILNRINNSLEEYKKQSVGVVIIEAALLIEKGGLINLVDKLIVVNLDEETQMARVKERDKLSDEEIRLRIEAQMRGEEKVKYADFVIDNSNNIENTERIVKDIWDSLN